MRRLTSRTGPARLSRRAVFHVDGRSFGAVITSDKDGYTAEATDLPALWSFAPTLDAALADLARLMSSRLGTDALPTWHTNPLDRRPDLRARFSRVVARALARAVDLTPSRPIQARGVDGMPRRPSRHGGLSAGWGLVAAAMGLTACAPGPPVPPAYTQEELAERCVRTGGWWHGVAADSTFSGFCEYSAPRFP